MDENDNAPEFPEEEYVTVLSEGPDTVGATIATVTAIDPDEGLNGTLRYAIAQGNLIQTFHINSISVRRGVDYSDMLEQTAEQMSTTTSVYDLCLRGELLLSRSWTTRSAMDTMHWWSQQQTSVQTWLYV